MLLLPYAKVGLLHLPLAFLVCLPMTQELLEKVGSKRKVFWEPGQAVTMLFSLHLGCLAAYRAYYWRSDVPQDHLWTSIAATTFGYHLFVWPLIEYVTNRTNLFDSISKFSDDVDKAWTSVNDLPRLPTGERVATPYQQFECGLAFWEIIAFAWDFSLLQAAGMLLTPYAKMLLLHVPLCFVLCLPMLQEFMSRAGIKRELPLMPGTLVCPILSMELGCLACYRAYYWRAEIPTDHLWTSIGCTTFGYHLLVYPLMLLCQHCCGKCCGRLCGCCSCGSRKRSQEEADKKKKKSQ